MSWNGDPGSLLEELYSEGEDDEVYSEDDCLEGVESGSEDEMNVPTHQPNAQDTVDNAGPSSPVAGPSGSMMSDSVSNYYIGPGGELMSVETSCVYPEMHDMRSRSPEAGRSSRSRSRSPLTFVPYVICEYDDLELSEDFMVPDAHELYHTIPSEKDKSGRRAWARGGRRGRGGRGRGRGRALGRPAVGTWKRGDPLTQIFLSDEDVPPELREMVMNVVRTRQARASAVARARADVVSDEGDLFVEASDGRDTPFMDAVGCTFEWSSMDSFEAREEPFLPGRTGSVDRHENAYDAFRSYWTDDILEVLVTQTNQYATSIESPSFQRDWYSTNAHEMLCLFSFWMMLGVIRMPTIKSCFSSNSILKTEIFRKIFTMKRYNNLVRALHFVDTVPANSTANSTITDLLKADQLYYLRPVVDHLNAKFQANYIPSKDIAIDESLTLWKGKSQIRQYIQSNAAKFGIKSFELCESRTGYLWSFIIYTGKHATPTHYRTDVNKSTAVVLKLIEPLLNQGYRLFMDNYYNSPLLARFLKRNGTDCVGTLRLCRQDVPPFLQLAPLQQGQFVARHSGDICVLSWQDKKRVSMLSTCHNADTAWPTVPSNTPEWPVPFKPQMILDYNKSMGGVDLKDQMLEPYLLERKRCAKWYMKLFKRLLTCSILNARILLQSSLAQNKDHLIFRIELVDDILKKHLHLVPLTRRQSRVANSLSLFNMPSHTHWPVRIPGKTPSDIAQNRHARLRCVVCLREGKPNIRSCYQCEGCEVALCIDGCFKKYHQQ